MNNADDDWRQHAACRPGANVDPELFFPVGDPDAGPAQNQAAAAKTVCRRCPVAAACLAWALESGQDEGVWGGMTPGERRSLKRGQRRQLPRPVHRDTRDRGVGDALIHAVDRAQQEHPKASAPRLAEMLGVPRRSVDRARAVMHLRQDEATA